MEIIIKVVISMVVIILIYYECVFLKVIWRSQIDPTATISKAIDTLKPKPEIIVMRDPNGIYQGSKRVGEVSGRVSEEGQTVIFERILNTTEIDINQPIEFGRQRLKVLSVEGRSGSYTRTVLSDSGTKTITGTDVLQGVKCERLKK